MLLSVGGSNTPAEKPNALYRPAPGIIRPHRFEVDGLATPLYTQTRYRIVVDDLCLDLPFTLFFAAAVLAIHRQYPRLHTRVPLEELAGNSSTARVYLSRLRQQVAATCPHLVAWPVYTIDQGEVSLDCPREAVVVNRDRLKELRDSRLHAYVD